MSYYDLHKDEIFKKYNNEELINDVFNYKNGKGRLTKVLNNFFEELIFQSKGIRGNLSPMEALKDEKSMRFIINYINDKKNFYKGTEIQNVKSFFRNAGRLACKVSNFDPRNARKIYDRYAFGKKEGLQILDTSAGFGSRMCATLLGNNDYYGIDPNTNLIPKLQELGFFLQKNNLTSSNFKLYQQGSEFFIPELENNIDICFTSPPYFDLEIYAEEKTQSLSYGNYDKWIKYFVTPTIENIVKYLKNGGLVMINIKNSTYNKKYKMYDDWFKIFNQYENLVYLETFDISLPSIKHYYKNTTYNEDQYVGKKEPVMVFMKIENKKEIE